MLCYSPLWDTMKKQGINKEALTEVYGISKSVVNRLNNNGIVKGSTLNYLCTILHCHISDIVDYVVTEEDVEEMKVRMENAKK